MDHAFERAVKEANEAQRKYLEEKATRDAEARPGMVSSTTTIQYKCLFSYMYIKYRDNVINDTKTKKKLKW